mgnify:CR=1 FL=1
MSVERDRKAVALAVGPALLYLLLFFLAPLALIVVYSLAVNDPRGDVELALTLGNYRRALDPVYLAVLARSVGYAALTTAISLLLGYPVASAVRAMDRRRQAAMLALLIIPSWMNLLVKNYAWIVLLRREGVINTLLQAAGLIDAPLPLLFTPWAVVIGLVHTYLPFMVLPVYAALERMDWRLVEAARDLGANRWQTFRRVILPQIRGGLVVGCVLVFIPSLGAFVTPDLLGGAETLMVATVVENQVLQVRDWPFASALAIALMALVIGALLLYRRFGGEAGQERVL